MASQVDYYRVLGVSREASQSEIRSAYRKLAKERHPDSPNGSEREFSRLQEAHDVLSDPDKRRQHDQELDLAHAADQLSGLDFGDLDDELAARRQQRESEGPGLGERLRNRFQRDPQSKEEPSGERQQRGRRQSDRQQQGSRGRGRRQREARWYEPQDFDPEPLTWETAAISFFGALAAFVVVGQLGFWANGTDTPSFLQPWFTVLGPFMFILYTLVGLGAAYFAFRAAGYPALALVFISLLVVGTRGTQNAQGPESFLQFGAIGVVLLLAVIYLGNRRDRAARER